VLERRFDPGFETFFFRRLSALFGDARLEGVNK
jgi:hypothetical protein